MTDTPTQRELFLAELSHLQAMLGRYDNFFYLSKQICLGFFGYLLILDKAPNRSLYLVAVPIIFFIMEFGYRFAYWSWHLLRLREVKNHVIRGTKAKLYGMSPEKDDIGFRFIKSLQQYDIIFYGVMLGISLYMGGASYIYFVVEILTMMVLTVLKQMYPRGL